MLLPRTLELFAAGQLTTSPEILFTKLRVAGVHSWTVEEQAAVEDLITAVWLAGLVAVAVMRVSPAGTAKGVGGKVALPLPSVVTLTKPR